MKTKRFVMLAVILGMAMCVSAQDFSTEAKYGVDSANCVTKLSIYREYYKQWEAARFSKDALSPEMVSAWREVWMTGPRASELVYTNGQKILEYYIRSNAKDKALMNTYIDSLMLLHDTRIIAFPTKRTGESQVASILGRKGYDLYTFNPSRYEEAYAILKEAVEMDASQVQVGFLDTYFRAAADMVNNGKAEKMTVIEVYQELSDVLDNNIKELAPLAASEVNDPIGLTIAEVVEAWGEPDNASQYKTDNLTTLDLQYGDLVVNVENGIVTNFSDPKKLIDKKYAKNTWSINNYKAVKNNIDNLFQPFASCEDLVKVFSAKMAENPDDINLLKRITTILDKKDCTNEKLFLDASIKLYELEPSPESAYNIGIKLFKDGKNGEAAKYFEQATASENNDRVYRAYRNLAYCYMNMKSYSKSREAARKASAADPTAGEPYIIIGLNYAASAGDIGGVFDGKDAYWAAVDKFARARQLDESVAGRASELIRSYSQHFPSTETIFFNDYAEGQSFTVGGWINETTTIRAAK